MLVLLVVIVTSGMVFQVYKRPLLLAVHLILAISITIMAFFHTFPHMRPRRKGPGTTQQTAHVKLDPHKCQACWACVDSCPRQVLGKIDLPIHKHAKIVNPNDCIGCRKCVKSCRHDAITAIEEE